MKIVIILMLCFLFIFPFPAFEGAKSGLLLWFHTVLPSLLPFIIISNLIIKLNITKQISVILYPVFKKIFPISRHGCYPILVGFLSGMPMGAKATADLLKEKKISHSEATFLLTVCNNASPMFIMSFIALNQLKLPELKYTLFVIIYCSSIISALIYYILCKFIQTIPGKQAILPVQVQYTEHANEKSSEKFSIELLDTCIMDGFEVITKIGGYIILFSIIVHIFLYIVGTQNILSLSIIGLLELTNGVNFIAASKLSIETKIVLISIITTFGGLSGLAQTKSVIKDSRLSMIDYIKAKGIGMLITTLLTLGYVSIFLR